MYAASGIILQVFAMVHRGRREQEMLTFETINELTLKVTCRGSDVLFTKAGAFIAGDSPSKNYRFEKVLLGPQESLARAALGSLIRRATGENMPLMKATLPGRFGDILCQLRTAYRGL